MQVIFYCETSQKGNWDYQFATVVVSTMLGFGTLIMPQKGNGTLNLRRVENKSETLNWWAGVGGWSI